MHTVRAISLMILAMALLALSDLFIKLAGRTAPVGQIMLFLSLGGSALFVALARLRRVALITPDFWHPMVMLRNGCEIIGGIGLVIGITYIPLTTFAAIMQVAPILVTLGGAVFLRENVGWRRWAAVMAGLIGMLIVLRPGTAAFEPVALFAVLGVSGLAMRDLVTRLAPANIPSLTLSTWGFSATIPAGAILLAILGDALIWEPLTLAHIAGGVVVTTAGYLAITTAMRMAPVSIVAPFRYTRLIFTTGLGMMFFGERPDGPTILGAAIILAAGLYTFQRERRQALAGES